MERREGKPRQDITQQQLNQKDQANPEQEVEQKFEVTEREKYLLEVMAHIIAQGYLPRIGNRRDPESKKDMEEVLRWHINKRTFTSEK